MLGYKNFCNPNVMIFIKYHKVSTHMILPNFINLFVETALYSRFGYHKRGVVTEEKGEKRKYCRVKTGEKRS